MNALFPMRGQQQVPRIAIGFGWTCTSSIFLTFFAGMAVLPKAVVLPLMIAFFILALSCSVTVLVVSANRWHGSVLSHALAIFLISVVFMVLLFPAAQVANRIFGMKEIVPAESARTEARP